ncbi:replication protein P [Pseudomonas sp. RIT-PI-S]|uniref:replication protein P n=1 Tax=Pseudomonas sp. RIT-PI-S TaxID=3035295 RepID=UPI0021DB0A66|nr:replication protein P [Pseudomonas sp. RIT-PI-S]
MQPVTTLITSMPLAPQRSVRPASAEPGPVLTAHTYKPAPKQIDAAAAKVINTLFRELQVIFTGWRQAWPDDDAIKAAKATWTKAFMEEGITTIEQVRFGVQACRRLEQDFVPSPGRFIGMCRPTPESLGLPSMAVAYREATRNAHPSMAGQGGWSHAAVYHAAGETGFFELSNLPAEKSRALFERNYQIAVRAVLAGEPLRKMPLALPAQVSVSTPEVGRAALAALRKSRAAPAHE